MGKYDNLADAQKEVMAKLNKLGQAAGIHCFGNVIKNSPVDTGRFRGNWQASLAAPITAEVNSAVAVGRIEDVAITFRGIDITDVVYLTNNLPYAEALEFGWSDQQPSGWVRQEVARTQDFINRKAKEIIEGD